MLISAIVLAAIFLLFHRNNGRLFVISCLFQSLFVIYCWVAQDEAVPFDIESIVIPDYVHVPLQFTLNTKKFAEAEKMTVNFKYNANASLAERFDLPFSIFNEVELCWVRISEDEVQIQHYSVINN